jgi:hypothetical protein
LANFLGLTPGCRSSGDTERVGSITKIDTVGKFIGGALEA